MPAAPSLPPCTTPSGSGDGYAEPLDRELLPALEAERVRRVREDAAAVEPTRVDFFTLVRGED